MDPKQAKILGLKRQIRYLKAQHKQALARISRFEGRKAASPPVKRPSPILFHDPPRAALVNDGYGNRVPDRLPGEGYNAWANRVYVDGVVGHARPEYRGLGLEPIGPPANPAPRIQEVLGDRAAAANPPFDNRGYIEALEGLIRRR